MASISSVRLEITEKQGSAVAKVSYAIRGDKQDVLQRHVYREFVELIGDDGGPGEDGQHEPIAGGTVFNSTIRFSGERDMERTRLLPLPSSALDEDPGRVFLNPIIPIEDEIRARVTLTQIPPPSVSANSNLVRRGGLVIFNVVQPA